MLRPKTVMLYLIDGIPQGRIKASLSNWTGVCYLLPRTDLIKSKDRSDLQQSGVYLLFGADDDGNQRVYIGQARKRKNNKGVLGRIMEHRDEEKTDYWTQAVAIVTSNNALGPTEISYLEHRFTGMRKVLGVTWLPTVTIHQWELLQRRNKLSLMSLSITHILLSVL